MDSFACIGLDAKQVQLQTDRIAKTLWVAILVVHPVTKASSEDEFVGPLCKTWRNLYDETCCSRSSAPQRTLRRVASSSRGILPLRVFFFFAASMSLDSFKHVRLIDAYPRRIDEMWSSVRRELRRAASSLP